MRRVAAVGVVALAAVLVAAQLVLPGRAERALRDRLERNGRVQRVEVHAFPAIELLWGHADRVVVRMSSATAGTGRLADLLARARDAGRLDARVNELTVLLLRLRDVRVRKRGDRLTGEATVADADLRAALPPGFDVRPVASGDGQLVFEGTARLFGQAISARARVLTRDGRLLVEPEVPFGGLVALAVFSDPRIQVTSVGARGAPGGFTLTAAARLR